MKPRKFRFSWSKPHEGQIGESWEAEPPNDALYDVAEAVVRSVMNQLDLTKDEHDIWVWDDGNFNPLHYKVSINMTPTVKAHLADPEALGEWMSKQDIK